MTARGSLRKPEPAALRSGFLAYPVPLERFLPLRRSQAQHLLLFHGMQYHGAQFIHVIVVAKPVLDVAADIAAQRERNKGMAARMREIERDAVIAGEVGLALRGGFEPQGLEWPLRQLAQNEVQQLLHVSPRHQQGQGAPLHNANICQRKLR